MRFILKIEQYLIIVFLFLSSLSGFADDAPMDIIQSGSAIPIDNNKIMMLNEKVILTPYDNFNMKVECYFTFRNTSRKGSLVKIGFPGKWQIPTDILDPKTTQFILKTIKSNPIKYLKVQVNGRFIKPKIVMGKDKKYPYWYIWSVYFGKHQKINIKHTYIQRLSHIPRAGGYHVMGSYILKTGKYWKGKINNIKILIDYSKCPLCLGFDVLCFKNIVGYEMRNGEVFKITESRDYKQVLTKRKQLEIKASSLDPNEDFSISMWYPEDYDLKKHHRYSKFPHNKTKKKSKRK